MSTFMFSHSSTSGASPPPLVPGSGLGMSIWSVFMYIICSSLSMNCSETLMLNSCPCPPVSVMTRVTTCSSSGW